MRTREQIDIQLGEVAFYDTHTRQNMRENITLELLLDIRELLTPPAPSNYGEGHKHVYDRQGADGISIEYGKMGIHTVVIEPIDASEVVIAGAHKRAQDVAWALNAEGAVVSDDSRRYDDVFWAFIEGARCALGKPPLQPSTLPHETHQQKTLEDAANSPSK